MTDALPQGMLLKKAPIVAHRKVAADHYLMRLKIPRAAQRARPGQFLHLLCPPGRFAQEPVPFLRRPFSIFDVHPKAGTVDFIYKVVGTGTATLAQARAGDFADCLAPLGRPFEVPPKVQTVLLVGGGVGIPPLYFLAKTLRKTHQVIVFLGARTRKWVICAADFKKLGVPVHVATDDGSRGSKGSVVDLLEKKLSGRGDRAGRVSCICGPTPMMAAAARATKAHKVRAQVSLEERMGCALGVCWGCCVEVTTERVGSHARFQRVCSEGPVFDAAAVAWSVS